MTSAHRRSTYLLTLLILLTTACRQQQLTAADIQLEMSVTGALVGETTLLVTVKDEDGKAIDNLGALSIRGDMDHAGMLPVFAEAAAAVNGVFTIPFEWTMGGGWIVEASLRLENGQLVRQTFEFEILTEARDGGMTGMDHDADMAGMDHSALGGESSAVYMQITNRGDTDISILSASSAAANRVELHQTIIENDIARMEAQNGLLIPAGETVELGPAGAHIMLMALTADLVPNNQFALQLICDSGETYNLDISVADMRMNDLDDAIEIGDLVFSNRWARPARAGGAHGRRRRRHERDAGRSPLAGIGFGLYADYGAAQRLYVKCGYLPDGRGRALWVRSGSFGQVVPS